MPKLHHNFELVAVKNKLPEKIASSLSKGITEKKILEDQFGAYYLIKKPDTLTVYDVFKGYLSDEQLENPDFDPKKHIFSIQLEGAFLEIVIPRMAKKMFEGILIVPENYLHVEDKSIGVISKFINNFSEFLSQKDAIKIESLFDREHLPKRNDLSLTPEEAMIIGQLYAVALVFNLWDLLNSKLLNSGYCLREGIKQAAIVDFGCGATLSYKGRHADTLAMDDPNFLPAKKIDYSFFGQYYRDHYRHGYALPFDQLVAPLLPHTIISDLFNMSGKDPISQAMLEGFCHAITTAEKNMAQNPCLLEEGLAESYTAITLDSSVQADELQSHLNTEFYSIKPKKDSHSLIHLLQQRLISAKMLISKFQAGISATSIQEEIRDYYYHSQKL
ncbi:hypothetical protein Lgra_1612 [Legionella gratiana]|uniref:Uncharacterized protein n=1 Tax=Legionella gratiana TaxID=45066 RepID=A0A378J8V2_9GAMM|nr:hypothetical protein [Legionella gratiana]KTD10646.1 hypothetical protein Lgra_1612 [Legionella gratiana]STX43608.1 Uncharacterised protein [Legionella gratiana]